MKTALVTGGGRGIGRAVAEALGAEGCNLHLSARSAPLLAEVADKIRKDHGVTRDKAGEYYRILPAMVEKLSKAGRVPRGSVHCVAQTLWAGCYGLTTYLINMPAFGWVEVDELISLMVDGLVDGLTPERN